LQEAQEVGMERVRPLRVNLPTRGVRAAFTQALQTEIGKPMIIQFAAANTKAVSWPKRLALGGFVFLALWGGVATVSRRVRQYSAPIGI